MISCETALCFASDPQLLILLAGIVVSIIIGDLIRAGFRSLFKRGPPAPIYENNITLLTDIRETVKDILSRLRRE